MAWRWGQVLKGAELFIKRFYSTGAIIRRSFNTKLSFSRRLEFILFNLCYRDAYLQWIEEKVLRDNNGMDRLIIKKFKKNIFVWMAESGLSFLRR